MAQTLDNSALLARSYRLARGPRVRIRLAQIRDATAVRTLLAGVGSELEELELVRLLRFDPRRRIVICASALVDSTETVAGVGAISLGADEPELLVVDRELTEGLDTLLRRALIDWSRAAAGRSAA